MMDRWTKEDVLDALQYINDHDPVRIYMSVGIDKPVKELEITAIALDGTEDQHNAVDVFVKQS